jgi:subtilase family serine protease
MKKLASVFMVRVLVVISTILTFSLSFGIDIKPQPPAGTNFEIKRAALPDLKVNKIYLAKFELGASQYVPLTDDPLVGKKVWLVCDFSNIGGVWIDSVKVGYYVDGNWHYYNTVGNLPAGSSRAPGVEYTPDSPGTHNFKCVVDDGNAIVEKDENNNSMSMKFNVVTPLFKPVLPK